MKKIAEKKKKIQDGSIKRKKDGKRGKLSVKNFN